MVRSSVLRRVRLSRKRFARVVAGVVAVGGMSVLPAVLTPVAAQAATVGGTGGPVSIPAVGTAAPYPATANVGSVPAGAVITDVNVQLNGLSHSSQIDIDMVLIAPNGASTLLLSDAGRVGVFCGSGNVVLDDEAAQNAPVGPCLTGSFRPTNHPGNDPDTFPGITPPPETPSLSRLDGGFPTGVWRLHIVDDSAASSGGFLNSWSLEITYVAPPSAPTGVQATPTSSTSANVSFTPGSDGGSAVTGFTAQCSSSTGGAMGQTVGAASPLLVTGLTPGASYRCQVRATNSQGPGAWSDPSPVIVMPAVTPDAPTGVSAAGASPTSATVSFTPGGNGGSAITGYTAECSSDDGGTSSQGSGEASPLTVAGLSPGKNYRCRVRATNSVGDGAWSADSQAFLLPSDVPGAPTEVAATAASPTTATVSFTPGSDNGAAVSAYTARCESSDGGVVGVGEGASSPVTVTGLTEAKTYECRVRAVNSVGEGPWSEASAPFVLPDVTAPDTTITSTVPAWPLEGPTVEFSSPDADAESFECRLDVAEWAPCTSPSAPAWKAGSHQLLVRAIDESDNVDTTPALVAWTTPYDDTQLATSGAWSGLADVRYYRGSARTTKAKGAALTKSKVRSKAIVLVATKCSGCGTVDVYYGTTRLKRISLDASTTQDRVVIPVKKWSSLQPAKPIKVVVVTSGKKVVVDGLGSSRR